MHLCRVFKLSKNSFHTVEVGKVVARVRKKNIQAEVKCGKIRINCQQKEVFHISESRNDI